MKKLAVPFLCLAAACGPPEDEHSEVESELNGTIVAPRCLPDRRTKVQQAFDHLVFNGFGNDVLDCIRDAQLFANESHNAEQILTRLAEYTSTEVVCVDVTSAGRGNGWAPIGGPEHIELRNGYIDSASIPELAGLILHEITHNKGFNHVNEPFARDYDDTVPVIVGRCIASGASSPGGSTRSGIPLETELAHIGGLGGSTFERTCPNNSFVRGAIVDYSSHVNRIRFRCDGVAQAAVGSYANSTSTTDRSCSAGWVAVGVWGFSDSMVRGLGLLCAREIWLESGVYGNLGSRWLGGAFGQDVFRRQCPDGMAIKAVRGQAGGRVDGLTLECQRMDEPARPAFVSLPLAGSSVGTKTTVRCKGFGAMKGLYGRGAAEVDRLGGYCVATDANYFSAPQVYTSFANVPYFHDLEPAGGWGGTYSDDYCDQPDAAMIGLWLRAGARIDSVQGICARMSDWSGSPSVFVTTRTDAIGGNGGVLTERRCARGQYLAGWDIWTRTGPYPRPTVHGIRPICRGLTPSFGAIVVQTATQRR